jgi:hypothetical protein
MNKDNKNFKEVNNESQQEIKEVKTESSTKVDMSEVTKELLALRKELDKLKTEKKSFSDAEKAAIEEAREEMLTDDEIGALYIDDKYKEDGYSYRIIDSSRPGRVQQMIKRGYSIVEDSEMKIGQGVTGSSNQLGAAVTVELGRTKSCLGILMKMPKEKYDARQKAKARAVRETSAAMMQDMVDKSEFGTITIGDSIYKK